MLKNKKKFENPNGGFATPMILFWIISLGIGIAGLIYFIAKLI